MSRDASGNYTLPGVVNPVVSGTPITVTWGNSTLADLQTAMTDSLDRNGRGSMLAPLKVTDGTDALPSLTFANDTNTGIYRIGSDSLGISTGAVLRVTVNSVGLTALALVPSGSTVPTNGLYLPAANTVGLATGTTLRLSIDTTSVLSTLPYVAPPGAVGTPSFTFVGDLNTGFYSPGADQLAAATAGVLRWSVNSTGNHTFAAPSSGNTLTVSAVSGGNFAEFTASLSGVGSGIATRNTSNTASSDAYQFLLVGGGSAGDPYQRYDISGVQSWSHGIDNSDSDKFKISASATLGTSDKLAITPAGILSFGAGSNAGIGSGADSYAFSSGSIGHSGAQYNVNPGVTYEFVNRGTGDWWFYTDTASKIPFKIAQLAPTDTLRLLASSVVDLGGGSGKLTMAGGITRFESAEQTTPSATGLTSVAHGGPRKPDLIRITLRCKTTELGYAVGDEVDLCDQHTDSTRACVGYANATNVVFNYLASGVPPALRNTSGTLTQVTAANWRVVFYAHWL